MRARGSARERCRECARVVVVSARARKLRLRRRSLNQVCRALRFARPIIALSTQRPTRRGGIESHITSTHANTDQAGSMPLVTYETCDVFATTKFGGNPLAVFFLENADQLTSKQMQLLAREVGCKYPCATTATLPYSAC